MRLTLFALVFASLQFAYNQAGNRVEHIVIDRLTVSAAARLIRATTPTVQVEAVGPRLVAPGGGLNVLKGCEGTDVLLILLSAILVAPLPWRSRVLGILAGTLLVFALNQFRVVALFHAYREQRSLFDTLHGTVAPLLLVACTGAFFAAWLWFFQPTSPSAPRP